MEPIPCDETGSCGPFVKKLRTASSCYLYDVNTNRIVRVDEAALDLIDYFHAGRLGDVPSELRDKHGADAVSRCGREFEQLARQHAVFRSSRPVVALSRGPESLEQSLASGLHQLILELTQSCNLSCRYCIYSGRYPDERTHSARRMSRETAFRAIEFFLARADTNASEVPVTFYGGEPLLNFALLKDCVEHAIAIGGPRVRAGLTTNAVLLNEEVAKYLIARNVRVTVSLDGPRSMHDRWRLDARGRGSYSRVRGSLDLIRRLDPEYFDRNVSLSVVLAPPVDLGTLEQFFFHTPEFARLQDRLRFNLVHNPAESDLRGEAYKRAEAVSRKRIERAKRRYQRALAQGTVERLNIERALFDTLYLPIWKRPMRTLDGTISPVGFCIPGRRRLYVDSRGRLFMCEKMAHHIPIGDVERGFDLGAIARLYARAEALHRGCGECWAVRLCSKCFNTLRQGDELSTAKFESTCRMKLSSLESNLSSFCAILEKNPDAFRSFESITVS